MALMPKRTKYRKVQRGNMAGLAQTNNKLDFGDFGLLALERGWVRNNEIEAARVAITRYLNRRGRVWIRVFPDKPFTCKPFEVRMGKGKGNVEGWVAVVLPGRVLFEISGCTEQTAREALCRAAAKLSIKTKLLSR
jgi:large subunit ribosomal protein L16